ncbi:IS1182 family transposase [Ichthyobacterium seriolicida]|uniref:Transposase n=2 Tax=Ichthyobacterium seriolicida TaxID=242600 RepID=A0A1J1E579_9FLAO|nr:IS1182 family transposase [Ichthyobacterium seriolicida]BAV95212.1 transposase [Ichthyobacterium seriolicida]
MNTNFRDYNQQQNWLFPPSIEELIPADHPVRVVNGVIEQLNLNLLISEYSKEGKPSYHPKMMLKVMVYAYMDNTYSSRKIEKAMRENIIYMWLSAQQVVDHNTIARFRSKKLKTIFKDIFKQVVLLLADEGLLTLKEVFTDGTKIESMAGRYTFVWGNAIKTRKEKMSEQLENMWQYAQSIADEEDIDPTAQDFSKIDKEKVEKTATKINKILKGNTKASSKAKAKARYMEKNFPINLEKYQQQEQILSGRNSYSKTDLDATFIRMKEDHMLNGQLKPGYNVQISTESQFIIHYSLHQNTNDIHTLKPHLQSYEKLYQSLPKYLSADAGYGSEENYQYLEDVEISGYVKYNTFDKEQRTYKSNRKKNSNVDFHRDNLHYNEQEDYYVCPMVQRMDKIYKRKNTTKSGYNQTSSVYQAQNCQGCSLRGLCHKSKYNRKIERNHHLERHKNIMRNRLKSNEGQNRRKKRTSDVEPVFGHIKSNRNFKRFTHKGIKKAELEFGLHALAHNLRKKVS